MMSFKITVATSSGESEYYAAVRAGSAALGARTLCEDSGFRLEAVGHIDSTAARAMAMRRGLGKAKHIAGQYVWPQGRIHSGDRGLKKVCLLYTSHPAKESLGINRGSRRRIKKKRKVKQISTTQYKQHLYQ